MAKRVPSSLMNFLFNSNRFWLALLMLFAAKLSAEENTMVCRQAMFAPSDSSDARKYAPSREIDILHLALDVTPDFKARSVSGTVTFRFQPIARPLQELKLDGVDLSVQKVTSPEKVQHWEATDKQVIITFDQAIPVG